MTDKTPKNTAETPVNTPATLARTTNTARDGEPKSRALPQPDALKDRFKAGSIPLQTDFADLIDLANMGRQAVGGAEGQTGPANGFTLSSEGRLELKPNAAKGISADQDGVAVKIGNGMRMSSTGSVEPEVGSYSFGSVEEGTDYSPVKVNSSTNGLVVDLHQGLINTVSGLSVNVKNGLQLDSAGVGVKAGNCVAVNSSGVNIKLAKGASNNGGGGQGTDGFTSLGSTGGLVASSNGLSVDAGNGIQIDNKGVSIKLAANSGLSADETNGLKIAPDQTFQQGMIIMFSGSNVPSGWALCDGSGNTPNLIDRFILGGNISDVNQKNNAPLSGNSNDKKFSVTTDEANADINVTVDSHTLTISEMPTHSHRGLESIEWVSSGGGLGDGSKNKINYGKYTENTGGGKAHGHGSTVTQNPHSHNASVILPYYILAFIIKL